MSKLIYFMRPVGQIGPIKIGCSRMPQRRLDALSIVSPVRLEIICAVPGSHKDERKLHSMFAAHWTHHEWFGASKELLALVDYAATYGLLPELPEVKNFVLPRAARAPKPASSPSARVVERGLRFKPLYEGGATCTEIAKLEGLGLPAVARALKAVGVQVRRGKPQGRGCQEKRLRDAVRAEEFKRRYLAGDTLEIIGQDHGVTRERVRQVLRKLGVPSLGHRKEHCRQAAPLKPAEIAAANLYKSGVRPSAVFAKYPALKPHQLRRALIELGIPIRDQGSWTRRADDAELTASVAELYQRGLSPSEIVEHLPALKFPETVYRYLKKAGVKPHRRKGYGRGSLEARAAEVIAAHRGGLTIKSTAEKFGASVGAVTNLLERHGAKVGREEIQARRVEAVRRANRLRWHQHETRAAA